MKATGIVRRIDDLGRIVIPKEIRRNLRIRQTDPIEIYTDAEGQIILKKYSPLGELTTFADKYAQSLSEATGTTVCITDRDQVIAASGQDKKQLINKQITKAMENVMNSRSCIVASESDRDYVNVADDVNFKQEAIHPIISAGDVLGSVSMFSNDVFNRFSDNEKKLVKTAADFLGRHMEA